MHIHLTRFQFTFLIISLLCFTHLSHCIKIFARTSKSLVLLNIDPKKEKNSFSNTLVETIVEDVNALLTVDTGKNIGYYFIDGTLYSLNLKSGESSSLGKLGEHNTEPPSTMSFDWKTNTIYIGVQGNHESGGRIESCLITNTSVCTVVLNDKLDFLYSLILDPEHGRMFWLNGVTNSIETSTMSGYNHQNNAYTMNVKYRSHSPVYHSQSNRVFFIRSSSNSNEIVGCSVNTSASCEIITSVNNIISLLVSENHLLWTASARSDLWYCEVADCNRTISKTMFNDIDNMVLADGANGPPSCLVQNGKCSHFCLNSDNSESSRCACPIGIALEKDQRTCRDGGIQKALFVSSLNGVFMISLDTFDHVAIPLFYENGDDVMRVDDIEFESKSNMVYWIEDERNPKDQKIKRFVKRGYRNGTNIEIILTIPTTVSRIKINSDSGNLYWLDDIKLSRIGVTSLVSLFSKTLIHGDIQNIKSFAIVKADGSLIVSHDSHDHSIIDRFDSNGRILNTLITLPKGVFVTDLNIDNDREILFWIEKNSTDLVWMDLKSFSVSRIEFDETNRLPQPSTLEVVGTTVFINSFLGRSILQVSIDNIHVPHSRLIETPIFGAKGMTAVEFSEASVIRHTSCSRANGYCEHICVENRLNSSTIQRLQSDYLDVLKDIQAFDVNKATREIFLGGTGYDNSALIVKTQYPKPSTVGVIEAIISCEIVLEDLGIKKIFSVAVDHVSGNIYWSDSANEQIEVCDKTGKYRKVLAWKQIKPRQIVLHLRLKVLYFIDANKPGTIKVDYKKSLLLH
ncbi:unnamed protein product [Caenorhabditis bovis]|uniref:EGF-like domain-containing protein n=1 Tax=Caenorhabditis bovis TaxID=2654633 RepID=A0A8S1ENJ6_9PELO|nr:unnamed protein product [Caenorhabditis bovis]